MSANSTNLLPMRSVGPRQVGRLFGAALVLALLAAGDRQTCRGSDPDAYQKVLRELTARQRAFDWPAVVGLLEQALELNPTVARHWWDLGLARARTERFAEAIAAFERADELGCGFAWDPVFFLPRGEALYQIAICHVRAGQTEEAVSALHRALAAGLRRPGRLLVDARLEALRQDPRVRELAGAVAAGALTRDEGFRADLRFLAREMFRLHFNPFHETPRETFDAQIAQLDAQIPQLSDHEIAVAFQRLLCLLGDGHTNLRLNNSHWTPVQFFWFDEGLFVVSVPAGEERLLGAQVLQFGERETGEVLEAFRPIAARDNEMTVRAVVPRMLRVTEFHVGLGLQTDTSGIDAKVRLPDGSEEQVRWSARPYREQEEDDPSRWVRLPPGDAPLPLSLTRPNEMLWFEPITETNAVYAAINGIGNPKGDSFPAFTARLLKYVDENPQVERLILDFRRNGGGNTFLNRPLIQGLVRSRLNTPGGLVVLIGRTTFSAAQNTVTEIERHTAAVFVGEPTGSRPNFIGETVPFQLPYSQHAVSISDLYWGTSSPLDRRMWIAPQLYVPPTAADYLARRDPALEAAIDWQPHDQAAAKEPAHTERFAWQCNGTRRHGAPSHQQ